MKLKELKELLNNFPDEIEVICYQRGDRFYDYEKVNIVEICEGIPQQGWIANPDSQILRGLSPSRNDKGSTTSYLFIGY